MVSRAIAPTPDSRRTSDWMPSSPAPGRKNRTAVGNSSSRSPPRRSCGRVCRDRLRLPADLERDHPVARARLVQRFEEGLRIADACRRRTRRGDRRPCATLVRHDLVVSLVHLEAAQDLFERDQIGLRDEHRGLGVPLEQIGVLVPGEHHDAGSDLDGRLDDVEVGVVAEQEVEHHDVGAGGADQAHGARAAVGEAHHVMARASGDRLDHVAEESVLVAHDDPHRADSVSRSVGLPAQPSRRKVRSPAVAPPSTAHSAPVT